MAACALTSRSEPRELRSFTPELAPPGSFVGTACARIRLGRVFAGSSLRLAIQRRVSPVELQAYETLRWTELPDTYARRALVHALFARPLEQAVTGPAHVLDVEVVAFEEVASSTSRAGRVVLRYELRNARQVVARGEATVVRPASATAIEAVVAAIGDALSAASERVADQVVAAACT
jgi:ABC-type uncharacterized transport system auxiliary subunit